MSNVTLCLLVYIICTWLTSVTPLTQTGVLLRRLKRQESLFRRLDSLIIRVEHLEVDFRKEQEKSDILQAVVKKLTTETDEFGKRIFTEESDKISETVVQKTTEIIQNDLQDIRHGLGAEKARSLQLARSQQEYKGQIIKMGKLVGSLENTVQDCKIHANKTETMLSSFGNSVQDILVNMSRLSEDVSELKITWTVRSNPDPEQSGGELVTDTATCSRCLEEADIGVSNLVRYACQKKFSYLYLVTVKSIQEESSSRKIYTDLVKGFDKRRDMPYDSTSVVMTESRNCNGCSTFTTGSTYLIMAQDRLTVSTQEGSRFEFLLNGRSFHILARIIGKSKRTDHITIFNSFIWKFLQESWEHLCEL